MRVKLLSKMALKEEQGFYNLPDEMLLEIFQYFKEQHLCRVSQVCALFWRIANDKLLWKLLYCQVYEYDQPLFNLEPCKFEFKSLDESVYKNPWKESFKQLYRSVHVRRGFQNLKFEGRNLQYFNNIYDALDYVRRQNRRDSSFKSLVFLHAGTYNLDDCGTIYIESDVVLIGAARGKNIAESVIIEGTKDVMRINRDVERAYVGYLTLELTSNASTEQLQFCCLDIHGSPIVDNCIIRSSNCKSAAVLVSGNEANPLIKNCNISECKYSGLEVYNSATGIYKDNQISYNAFSGISITDLAQPTICRNIIHYNDGPGICIFFNGSGCFEDNEVYNNTIGFDINKTNSKNLIIRKNKISNKENKDTQLIGISFRESYGKVEDNDICDNLFCGVEISEESNPVIRRNTIQGSKIGIFVSERSSGLFEQNYIFNSTKNNVKITKDSKPILKRNHIFDGQGRGIYIKNRSTGVFEANVIFENAQMGVLISTESKPLLKKNRILNNVAAGVEIDSDATATLKYNIIQFNGSNGLHLAAGVRQLLILKGNKICHNNRS